MRVLIVLFAVLFFGCKSPSLSEKTVLQERETLKETTVGISKYDLQQSDSVYVIDSVRVIERHDTVLIERKIIKNVAKKVVEVVKDTVLVVKIDTVQVKDVEVRHERPPENRKVSKRVIAFCVLCAIIVLIGYRDVKKRWG